MSYFLDLKLLGNLKLGIAAQMKVVLTVLSEIFWRQKAFFLLEAVASSSL